MYDIKLFEVTFLSFQEIYASTTGVAIQNWHTQPQMDFPFSCQTCIVETAVILDHDFIQACFEFINSAGPVHFHHKQCNHPGVISVKCLIQVQNNVIMRLLSTSFQPNDYAVAE